jgi:hypothetical protein
MTSGRRWRMFARLNTASLMLGCAVACGGPPTIPNVEQAAARPAGSEEKNAESCSGSATLLISPGLKRAEQEVTFSFAENSHRGICISTLPISGTKAHQITVRGKGDCNSAIFWVTDRIQWQTADRSERFSLIEFVSTLQIMGDVVAERSIGRITDGDLKDHIIENNTIGKIDPRLCDSMNGVTEITLTGMYNTSLG